MVPDASAGSLELLRMRPLLFLLGSRYWRNRLFSKHRWAGLFGNRLLKAGSRSAICDFVHGHLRVVYEHANFN